MKKFEEISQESQNFFDYIVYMNINTSNVIDEIVENVLETILKLEEEFVLSNDFFYKEDLLVTHSLVKERIENCIKKCSL